MSSCLQLGDLKVEKAFGHGEKSSVKKNTSKNDDNGPRHV